MAFAPTGNAALRRDGAAILRRTALGPPLVAAAAGATDCAPTTSAAPSMDGAAPATRTATELTGSELQSEQVGGSGPGEWLL